MSFSVTVAFQFPRVPGAEGLAALIERTFSVPSGAEIHTTEILLPVAAMLANPENPNAASVSFAVVEPSVIGADHAPPPLLDWRAAPAASALPNRR